MTMHILHKTSGILSAPVQGHLLKQGVAPSGDTVELTEEQKAFIAEMIPDGSSNSVTWDNSKKCSPESTAETGCIPMIDNYEVTTGNGFIPVCLGFIYGLQYNKRGPTECYESIMLNLLTLDEMVTWGAEIYLPQNWINFAVAGQDFVNAAASISDRCEADVFLVKFAEICSIEGLTQLGLRIMGALLQQGIGFGLHTDQAQTFDSSSQNTVPYTSMSF